VINAYSKYNASAFACFAAGSSIDDFALLTEHHEHVDLDENKNISDVKAQNSIFHSSSDCQCRHCGSLVEKGKPLLRVKVGSGFTNQQQIANPENKFSCMFCFLIFNGEKLEKFSSLFLIRAGSSIYTEQGIYRLLSNEDFARFFEREYNGPTILVKKTTSNSQHLVWRSTVNPESDVMQIRLGDRLLRFRFGILKSIYQQLPDLKMRCQSILHEKMPDKYKSDHHVSIVPYDFDYKMNEPSGILTGKYKVAFKYFSKEDQELLLLISELNEAELVLLGACTIAKSKVETDLKDEPNHLTKPYYDTIDEFITVTKNHANKGI
jgi:CRISPR type IV-associated protein Csf1